MSKKQTSTPAVENNDIGFTIPEQAPRPTVSAAAALGLPENPHDTLTNAVSRMRKDQKNSGMSSLNDALDKQGVEEKLEKTVKPTKEEKKIASEKPKLVSEKPVGEKKEGVEENVEEDDENVEVTEKKEVTDQKPKEVKVEKTEESEAVKRLQKENEDLKKRVEEIASTHKANTAAAPATTSKEDAPKAKTPEEIKKEENDWITDATQHLEVTLTEEDHEAILDGGPKAVAKVVEMRKRDMAQAVLRARQIAAYDFNPIVQNLMNQIEKLAPIYDDHIKLQAYRVEQNFQSSHPELKPHMVTARAVAKALYEKHPDVMNSMTEEETFKEVAKQTVNLLKSLGVEVAAASLPQVTHPVPVVTAPPVVAPTPVAAEVTPPAAKAAPVMPKPPGSTAPGAQAQGGSSSKEKNKAIAMTLHE